MGSKFSAEFRLIFLPDHITPLLLQSEGLTHAEVPLQSQKQYYYSISLEGGGREMLIRN